MTGRQSPDFGDQVHRLLYTQFGQQAREEGWLETLEDLGEAIIALAEGYRQDEPPPEDTPYGAVDNPGGPT